MVDAGFTRADGHRIVAEVLDAGRSLTPVVITAGDPDFYFGAEVIADAFPEAAFVAPADVIEHIQHSYEGKLEAWAHLGSNLRPDWWRSTSSPKPSLTVDGTAIEVRRGSELLGDRAWYLFEPDVPVADRRGAALRGPARVDRRQRDAGAASRVGPGPRRPRVPRPDVRRRRAPRRRRADRSHRDHPHPRLPDQFEQIVAEAPDAAAAKDKLLAAYPDAGLVIAADLGTKVAKGEMTWG